MFIKILKNKYLMISCGAVFGAIFSWKIDDIFIVNILGCSFSTFISDFYMLILNNNFKRSTLLILFSILLGILFFNFGYLIISN